MPHQKPALRALIREAEEEILHPLHLEVSESPQALTVHAEVPGFSAKELEVGMEPHRLTISGKHETSQAQAGKKTTYTGQWRNRIFRTIDLPADVDTSKVTATLRDGVLELSMPKAAKVQKVQIEEEPA